MIMFRYPETIRLSSFASGSVVKEKGVSQKSGENSGFFYIYLDFSLYWDKSLLSRSV